MCVCVCVCVCVQHHLLYGMSVTALGLGVDCYYLQMRSVNLGGRYLTLWVELPSVVIAEGAQRGGGGSPWERPYVVV